MPTIAQNHASAEELDRLQEFVSELPQGSSMAILLHQIVAALARGEDVGVLTSGRELTPNQAADLLHMSRPHLLKFMDCGELVFHRVGAHRRIKMADLMDFVDRREQAKADVAHTLGNPKALDDQARSAAAELSEADLSELDSI